MQSEKPEITKKTFNKKQIIAIATLVLVIVFLIVFGSLSLKVSAYDKIFPNVTVCGVDIGAVTTDKAKEKLEAAFKERLKEREFTLSLEDKTVKFKASDIEAIADVEKSVQNAYDYGKKGNIFKRVAKYIKAKSTPYESELISKINEEKTEQMISEIALNSEVPVKETTYSVSGDILTISNGHDGIKVDREKAKKIIKKAVFSGENNIKLNLEDAKPKKVDVDGIYKKITEGQKNAVYARENGEIVVIDGFPKVEMKKSDLKAALESGKDTYDIKVKVINPEITGEMLREMLFRDKIGSWTSYFSGGNVSRSTNVRLSASRINGVTLLPGETFSYDKTIGKRTIANGYKTATVYVGNTLDEGIGGGICQTSSTLYSAVLYANLEIVSRTSHSLPVSYMPIGQDATIAEGYIDFKFKNNTNYPIKIVCTTNYGSVSCSIMGVKPEGESVSIINTKTSTLDPKNTITINDEIPVGYKKITQKGQGGYIVASQRVVSVGGIEKKRENLTKSVYKAQDNIIQINSLDKNTPIDTLKIYDEETFVTEEEPVAPTVTPNETTENKETEDGGENEETKEESSPDDKEEFVE